VGGFGGCGWLGRLDLDPKDPRSLSYQQLATSGTLPNGWGASLSNLGRQLLRRRTAAARAHRRHERHQPGLDPDPAQQQRLEPELVHRGVSLSASRGTRGAIFAAR
jgi:hypothetical protein